MWHEFSKYVLSADDMYMYTTAFDANQPADISTNATVVARRKEKHG